MSLTASLQCGAPCGRIAFARLEPLCTFEWSYDADDLEHRFAAAGEVTGKAGAVAAVPSIALDEHVLAVVAAPSGALVAHRSVDASGRGSVWRPLLA